MITIVIPIYNRASLLKRTLNSIATSTYRPISLILVDNGSTDESMEIAREFQMSHISNDFDIYLTDEPEKGANSARNKGLSRVKSRYVYFFDNDDLFDADFLMTFEKLLAELIGSQQVPDMVCLTTNMQKHLGEYSEVRDYHFRGTDAVCNQILAGPLNTQSVIWRTDFLRDIGGWDATLDVWQDWELGVRALLHEPKLIWYKERAFHTIFVHPGSITADTSKNDRKYTMDIVASQLTDPRHLKALRLRRLNLRFHIPGLWKMAKYFR